MSALKAIMYGGESIVFKIWRSLDSNNVPAKSVTFVRVYCVHCFVFVFSGFYARPIFVLGTVDEGNSCEIESAEYNNIDVPPLHSKPKMPCRRNEFLGIRVKPCGFRFCAGILSMSCSRPVESSRIERICRIFPNFMSFVCRRVESKIFNNFLPGIFCRFIDACSLT